jgi:hypothetical protein
MGKQRIPRDINAIIKAARQQGWRVDKTKAGHLRFWPANGADPQTYAGTPSKPSGINNFISWLERSGFQWPPPRRKA